MRSRAFRIALLIFQGIWFNIIIPGHERGCIPLVQEQSSSSCCLPRCCADRHTSSAHVTGVAAKREQKSPRDPCNCAICFFAAHISLPTPIDLSLPPLGFCGFTPQEKADHLPARQVLLPFDGRAPPAIV